MTENSRMAAPLNVTAMATRPDHKVTTTVDVPEPKKANDGEAPLQTKPVRKGAVFFNVPCLTGLRGVAALGVVAGHLTGGTGAMMYLNGWEALQEMGNVAVLFFFVLSAFLLTVRSLTEPQRPPDAKYVKWSENGILVPWLSVRWIKYFIRRAFRILPLYWIVLVIIAAVSELHQPYGDLRNYVAFGWNKVLPYAFFYDVNSIFWTIPPEFEYYLIMPFYIVLYEMAERKDKLGEWIMGTKTNPPNYPYGLGEAEKMMQEHYRKGLHNRVIHVYYRFGRRIMLLIALTLINIWIVPMFWSSHGTINYYHIFPFMPRFWLGSLAAFIYHLFAQYGFVIYESRPKALNVNQKFSKLASKWISIAADLVLWVIVLVLFLTFPYYARILLHRRIPREPLSWYADHMGEWPVIGSAVIILVVSLYCRDRSFGRFFTWNFFTFAGEISFPLYMIHPVGIHLVHNYGIEGIDGVLFTFGSSMIMATLLHYLFEKPLGKIAARLAKYVQTTYFTKLPKDAVDADKHEELAVKKYNEMGLTAIKNPQDMKNDLPPERAETPKFLGIDTRAHSRNGPLFQIVPVAAEELQPRVDTPDAPPSSASGSTIVLMPTDHHQTPSITLLPNGVPEEDAPLAALAAHRSFSRGPVESNSLPRGSYPPPMSAQGFRTSTSPPLPFGHPHHHHNPENGRYSMPVMYTSARSPGPMEKRLQGGREQFRY
ncbi:acyltransferase family-domain-containing protein [Fimicolochytrium jonesii]|uniref:acyltransferase family-domain-containing protein n=1 Tax=Fimicolochytrium jonesii TaxID=1396493 RepID=UPI0022FE10B8|nr:acyltransferase family-domain-containing protein [Fimicolochytrium jonesii]KAI8820187.1 acyltransferase family-domain-containing protein [Fimicolochytrium jonesii]